MYMYFYVCSVRDILGGRLMKCWGDGLEVCG